MHWGLDLQNDWTPAFSTDKDRDEGLTISVNDVWGYTIHLQHYTGFKGKYKPFIIRMNFEEEFTGQL